MTEQRTIALRAILDQQRHEIEVLTRNMPPQKQDEYLSTTVAAEEELRWLVEVLVAMHDESCGCTEAFNPAKCIYADYVERGL